MTFEATDEAVDAARAYEALHVPALFGAWAPRVVEAAHVAPGDRVLDVACGTGVLARALRDRVGVAGQVDALDANPGMLRVASEIAPDVRFYEGLAGELPFQDKVYDAVVSQFGFMFFPDRKRALEEMLRVLRPGGRLAFAVWASLDVTEAYPEEIALLEREAGIDAANALRAPFVLGDVDELRLLAESAGVRDVEITMRSGPADFPSVRAMVEADLRGWLPVMGVHLDEPTITRILEEAESVLAPYVREDGRVRFDSPALLVTGRR